MGNGDVERFELDKPDDIVLDEDEQPEEVEVPEDKPEEPIKVETPVTKLEISLTDDKKTKKKKPRDPRELSPTDFDTFVEELAPGSDSGVYLTITRMAPVMYKGRDIKGYIQRFDEPVTSQQIKDLYGGGIYDIMIMGPKRKKDGTVGGNQLLSKKRLQISGDPKPEVTDEPEPSVVTKSDPDIVQQTLNAQADMVKQTREDRLAEDTKRDKLLEMLMTNKGGDKSLESILGVVTAMMESSKVTAEAQLVAAREDARQAREEQARERKEFREEMLRLRDESQKKEERAMNPLVEFMKESSRENSVRSERMSENMLKLAEIQRGNSEKVFDRQMSLMTESGKLRDDFLSSQLKNTMEELKDARKSSAGTLVDKLKEFKLIKGLFGNEEPEKDIMDRVGEVLPELPNIIQSFGYLFGKAPPAETTPTAPQITDGKKDEAPVPKKGPSVQDKRDQMRLAVANTTFTEEAETPNEAGMDPEKFTAEAVIGTFDTEILKKIARYPAETLVNAVKGSVKSEDSVIKTPAGRGFLNKVYSVIKSKYSS